MIVLTTVFCAPTTLYTSLSVSDTIHRHTAPAIRAASPAPTRMPAQKTFSPTSSKMLLSSVIPTNVHYPFITALELALPIRGGN